MLGFEFGAAYFDTDCFISFWNISFGNSKLDFRKSVFIINDEREIICQPPIVMDILKIAHSICQTRQVKRN